MNQEAGERSKDKGQRNQEKNKVLRRWGGQQGKYSKESKGRSLWFGKIRRVQNRL